MRKQTILKLIVILLLIIAGNTIYLFTKSKALVEINQKIEQDVVSINQPEEILKKLDERFSKSQSMHCVISMKVNGTLQTKTEVFIKKPTQVVLRYLQPDNGVAIGTNNKEMWVYFSGDNTLHAVNKEELEDMPQNVFANIDFKTIKELQQYKIIAETGAKEDEVILNIYPEKVEVQNTKQDAKITLKIDKNNWTIISEEHEKYDGTKVTIEYSDLNFSPLDDSIFEPPQNAKRYDNPAIFYEFLIQLYTQAEQYEIAKYFAEKAYQNLQGDDNKRLYAYKAASLCFKSKQYEEALKYYKEIEKYPLGENSKDTITYFKGITLWYLKRYNEAIAEFEKLAQKPTSQEYLDSLIAIGRIYYEGLNNKEESMQYLEKALNEAPVERRKEIQDILEIYKNM